MEKYNEEKEIKLMITTVNKFILYSSYFSSESLEISPLLNLERKDFAGLPVVNTLGFHCTGHRKKKKKTVIFIKGFFSYYFHINFCSSTVQIIKLRFIEIHLPRRFPS